MEQNPLIGREVQFREVAEETNGTIVGVQPFTNGSWGLLIAARNRLFALCHFDVTFVVKEESMPAAPASSKFAWLGGFDAGELKALEEALYVAIHDRDWPKVTDAILDRLYARVKEAHNDIC